MVHKQDPGVLDDEDSDGEINLLMDVRHGGRTVERRTRFVKQDEGYWLSCPARFSLDVSWRNAIGSCS